MLEAGVSSRAGVVVRADALRRVRADGPRASDTSVATGIDAMGVPLTARDRKVLASMIALGRWQDVARSAAVARGSTVSMPFSAARVAAPVANAPAPGPAETGGAVPMAAMRASPPTLPAVRPMVGEGRARPADEARPPAPARRSVAPHAVAAARDKALADVPTRNRERRAEGGAVASAQRVGRVFAAVGSAAVRSLPAASAASAQGMAPTPGVRAAACAAASAAPVVPPPPMSSALPVSYLAMVAGMILSPGAAAAAVAGGPAFRPASAAGAAAWAPVVMPGAPGTATGMPMPPGAATAVGPFVAVAGRTRAAAAPSAAMWPAEGATEAAGTRVAAAPRHARAHDREASMSGTIMIDGAELGRWVADHLAQAASRPPVGGTSFDPRMTPVWAGASIGG